MDETVHYWQDLTTEELANIVDEDTVAILPMAAIEQHGPHLPAKGMMSTVYILKRN